VSSVASQDAISLRGPIAVSFLLHALLAAAVMLARQPERPPVAPMYRVNLVAAPAAPRQIGIVQPSPPTPTPTPAAPAPVPLSRATPEPDRMRAPAKKPPPRKAKVATPNAATTPTPAPQTPPPVAGGGPTGGRGADVANVKTDGIDFPYPVYLQNVVRQIALQFKPSSRGALQAEVAFMIRRDGTIAGLRLTKRSSVFSFDQDALAAVEVASRAFGPLPQGFSDDVLPVIFSFDPRLIR
jgi:periplasmic protein TonB